VTVIIVSVVIITVSILGSVIWALMPEEYQDKVRAVVLNHRLPLPEGARWAYHYGLPYLTVRSTTGKHAGQWRDMMVLSQYAGVDKDDRSWQKILYARAAMVREQYFLTQGLTVPPPFPFPGGQWEVTRTAGERATVVNDQEVTAGSCGDERDTIMAMVMAAPKIVAASLAHA
jgi:hypothetical protein